MVVVAVLDPRVSIGIVKWWLVVHIGTDHVGHLNGMLTPAVIVVRTFVG